VNELVGLLGLAFLSGALFVALSTGRWIAVRALGVRGVPFPFGASARWDFATASLVPQAVGLLGALIAVYAVPGAMMTAGVLWNGTDGLDEASMRVDVERGGPADTAGVRDGDRIEAVNDTPVTSWNALRAAIGVHRGDVVLVVARDGQTEHLIVTPDAACRIGVRVPIVHRDARLGEALHLGAVGPAMLFVDIARGVVMTLVGSEKAQIAGPVGIVRESERAQGRGHRLEFLAVLGAYEMPFFAVAALFTGPGRRKRRRPAADRVEPR
jgi:regulator of sigma E protease